MCAGTPFPLDVHKETLYNEIMNALITQADIQAGSQLSPKMAILSRVSLFEKLTGQIPLNEYGLPILLYRADLIPSDYTSLSPEEQNSYLQAASVDINYNEGFPTFVGGLPIWGQMECESPTDYDLFRQYLGLADSRGYRQLAELQMEPGIKNTSISLKELRELFTYNAWSIRAKAKDLFEAAAFRKLRELRIMSATNSQFLYTEQLLAKIKGQMDVILSDENLQNVEPETAIKILEKLYAIQNRALGIDSARGSGQRSQSEEAPPPNASMEVTLRHIAKASGATRQAEFDQKGNSMDILLGDPSAAGLAQELIIRMSVGKGVNLQAKKTSEAALEQDAEADLKLLGRG